MSDEIVLFVASFFSVWIKFMTLNTKFIYATGRANLARPVAYINFWVRHSNGLNDNFWVG